METFKTRSGAILERRILENKGECKKYEFILRKVKEHGEDITLLGVYTLINPDYFTKKFIEEE